jgi:hypothetical protein
MSSLCDAAPAAQDHLSAMLRHRRIIQNPPSMPPKWAKCAMPVAVPLTPR